jgi:hypothetical protein
MPLNFGVLDFFRKCKDGGGERASWSFIIRRVCSIRSGIDHYLNFWAISLYPTWGLLGNLAFSCFCCNPPHTSEYTII